MTSCPRLWHALLAGLDRAIPAALVLLSFATAGSVLGQTLPSDGAWLFTGAAPAGGTKPDSIIVPAGSELFRTADADADVVSVRLVSQPYFGLKPAGWPSLEVGPAAVTFSRDRNGGAIVLLGDQALPLPDPVALDQAGRSEKPLDVTLSFDRTRNAGSLLLGGSNFVVNATAKPGPLEVAISPGDEVPWLIDVLDFQAPGSPTNVAPPNSSPAGLTSASPGAAGGKPGSPEIDPAAVRQSAIDHSRSLFDADNDEQAEKVLSDHNLNRPGTARWHLETANELLQMAFSFARAARPDRAAQIARRALAQLELVVRKADSPALAAAAEETAALLHEHLLADREGAKTLYRSAAGRFGAGGAAKELDRIERTEFEATRKGRTPRG